MSDVYNKNGSKCFWFFVIALLSQVVLFISVLSPEVVEKTMQSEIEMMVDVYGYDSTERIYQNSIDTSNFMLYESGVIDAIRNQFLPKEYLDKGSVSDTRTFNTNFWTIIDRSIHNIVLSVKLALLRIYSFNQWLYLLVITIVACILSGFLFREMKKHGFEYSSPLRHFLSRKLLYIMPLLIYIVIILPLSIHPFFYVVLMIMFCLPFSFYIANTIKRV